MSRALLSRFGLTSLCFAACALLTQPALADSQARIVRLSDVQGTVQINKNTGNGFESAFLNLPITQGTQLKTLANGRAEIEFEDGSTMRLAPSTSVEFSTLGTSDSGKHLSVVDLAEGMAYLNWLGKSRDEISLNFSREKFTLDHAAHVRVDTSEQSANLAVFKGDVEVEGPSGKLSIGKKKTATFNVTDEDKYIIANNIPPVPLDSWDKESIAYHDQYAKNNSSPYGYGAADLNYYGSYTDVPGYGMMWQPFFTGIGWDPFMDGAWGWYPGFGYMFASPYPWGWMPYRYGNWAFIPGFGWMWQPGYWNSWATVPRYTTTNLIHVHPLVVPPGTRTVVVGKGGPASTLTPSRLTINAGSGGLGIARGSINNLGHLNHEVARNGSVMLHANAPFAASSPHSSAFGGSSHSSMGGYSSMGHGSSGGHASGGGGGGAHR